ncbi:MAG: RNA 2',3'-cyclic phosphodiesterase [Thermoleophilia bacterium]
MGADRQRLFVGVPLPEELVGFVRDAQAGLPTEGGVRLTRSNQLHVTVCFLGKVGAPESAQATRILSELPCTMGGVVSLGGYVCLPTPARTRVVALGIEDGADVLLRLFERVASALEREDLFRREIRPFRPHLTIARLREPRKLGLMADMPRVEFEVRSVCLYRSVLSREGARYEVLRAVRFEK